MSQEKAEWLQAEQHFDATSFQPTAEDRSHLLSFLDAWEKAMAEQEKLMPMIEKLLAAGDVAAIHGCASWLRSTPHAGRYALIREWRRLSEAPAQTPTPSI